MNRLVVRGESWWLLGWCSITLPGETWTISIHPRLGTNNSSKKWFHPTLGSESVCLLGFSAGVPWVTTHKSCIPGALYPICSQRYWRESLPINFHCFYNSEERPAELVVMASESCEFPLTAQHLNLWPALTLFLPPFHHVSWVMEQVIEMPDYFLSFMAELLGHSSTLNVLEVWPVRILCCKY